MSSSAVHVSGQNASYGSVAESRKLGKVIFMSSCPSVESTHLFVKIFDCIDNPFSLKWLHGLQIISNNYLVFCTCTLLPYKCVRICPVRVHVRFSWPSNVFRVNYVDRLAQFYPTITESVVRWCTLYLSTFQTFPFCVTEQW